jgi:protein-disulfide isomerase
VRLSHERYPVGACLRSPFASIGSIAGVHGPDYSPSMALFPAAAALLLLAPATEAGSGACATLSTAEAVRASALMSSIYIHDCCDLALSSCLDQKPRCTLADRMAENVCHRVATGQADDAIRQAIRQRAWTMLPAATSAVFNLEGAPKAGDPSAPVRLVVYASPRGQHCARMVPGIYQAVTTGPLRGKVELAIRLFPLRSNAFDKEAGLALLASRAFGKFWDLALQTYAHFDDFTVDGQLSWAAALGVDPTALSRGAADPAVLDELGASKKEGLANGVESTPTFFIDGRLYRGELDNAELIDVLEEVWERSTGRVYVEGPP